MIAENKVERFVSRFEPSYHWLACHAALPLVLTPELVNYLRVQFLRSEEIPWIAEAISKCLDKAELARLLKISEDFKQQIEKSGDFQEFFDLAQISSDLLRKPDKVRTEALTRAYQVGDKELTVPSIIRDFEVNVATIQILESVATEETVQDQETIEFCARLSRYTKRNYRLPSEAEWEYACRANPLKSPLESRLDPPKSPLERGTSNSHRGRFFTKSVIVE